MILQQEEEEDDDTTFAEGARDWNCVRGKRRRGVGRGREGFYCWAREMGNGMVWIGRWGITVDEDD